MAVSPGTKQIGPVLTALFFIALVGMTIFSVRLMTKQDSGDYMADDIAQLAAIFAQIHADCTILSFDYPVNRINFLNVGSFAGSEVGPMNLAHPDRWQGPYVKDNPTMQDKEYEVVKAKDGLFVVPGSGVILPDGKIMGTDIVIDSEHEAAPLLRDALVYKGRPLAAALVIE